MITRQLMQIENKNSKIPKSLGVTTSECISTSRGFTDQEQINLSAGL